MSSQMSPCRLCKKGDIYLDILSSRCPRERKKRKIQGDIYLDILSSRCPRPQSLWYYLIMPRSARVILPGVPHHITQRGKDHQKTFINNRDFREYLAILKARCEMYKLAVVGYCLMPNHVHLVVIPKYEFSVADTIGYSHRLYTQRFNKRYSRSGGIWHQRFYSCPMDENHLLHALVYVDRNPVRAGMVDAVENYQWSSARAHVYGNDSAGLVNQKWWERFSRACDWPEVVRQKQTGTIVDLLRKHTISGKLLGDRKPTQE